MGKRDVEEGDVEKRDVEKRDVSSFIGVFRFHNAVQNKQNEMRCLHIHTPSASHTLSTQTLIQHM